MALSEAIPIAPAGADLAVGIADKVRSYNPRKAP